MARTHLDEAKKRRGQKLPRAKDLRVGDKKLEISHTHRFLNGKGERQKFLEKPAEGAMETRQEPILPSLPEKYMSCNFRKGSNPLPRAQGSFRGCKKSS